MTRLFIIFSILLWVLKLTGQTVNFSSNEPCFGTPSSLIGSANAQDTSISNWGWDFTNDGDFSDGIGKNTTHLFATADTFTVGLKVTYNNGGSDSVYKDVVVNPTPNVNFSVDNLCAGQPAVYSNESTISSGSIDTYQWDFNNDGVDDDISGPVVTYTVGPAATYITRLTCVSDLGCSAFATKTTQVFPQPTADFTTANACLGEQTVFDNESGLSDGSFSFISWDFDDGASTTSIWDVSHTYQDTGTYTVTQIVASDNLCKDTISKQITIHPVPDETITLSGSATIYSGESVDMSVPAGYDSYTWSTGTTSNITVASDSGIYTVTVTNTGGCSQVLSQEIYLKQVDQVEISSGILTPNSDGHNDYFNIVDLSAYETCSVTFYNRWNQEVYSSPNYQNDWNGTNSENGEPLDAGTYFYKLDCGGENQKVGSINILR